MVLSNPKHISWSKHGRFEFQDELVKELESSLERCLDSAGVKYSMRVRCRYEHGSESWWSSLSAMLQQHQHATNPIDRVQIEVVAPPQEDFAKFRREDEYHEGLLNPEDTMAGTIELSGSLGHSELVFRTRTDTPALHEIERLVFPILERAYFAQTQKANFLFSKPLHACLPWVVWIGGILLLDHVPYIGAQKLGNLSVTGLGIWLLAYFGISALAFGLGSWSPKRKRSVFERDGHFMWGDYGKSRQAYVTKQNMVRSKIVWGFGICALIGGVVAAYAKDFLDTLIHSIIGK